MTHDIVTYLPWLLSAITILQTYLAGIKWKNTWLLALGNQFLWTVFIFASETWGLLPLTATMFILCVKNHIEWSKPNDLEKDSEA